jgi:hypothetical protein
MIYVEFKCEFHPAYQGIFYPTAKSKERGMCDGCVQLYYMKRQLGNRWRRRELPKTLPITGALRSRLVEKYRVSKP